MMRKTAVLVTRRIGRSGELHNLFHDDWPRFPNDAPRCFEVVRLVIVVLCVHVISNVITAVCSRLIFGPKQSCAKLHRGFFDKTGESWESNLESGLADSSTIQFQNLQPKQTKPTTWTGRQQYSKNFSK